MPQVIEFPSLGAEARQQLLAFLKIARETPPEGESFAAFRSRLRAAKLWDRERPAVPLRFLGASGPTVVPSPFMQALAAARSDDDALDLVADRLLELNPLLFKTVVELIEQRPHGKDEVMKFLGSFAYRGKPPSRPDLESFFLALIVCGVARIVGIALVPGGRAERLKATLAGLDVDELLENPTPLPEPVIPSADDEGDAPAPVADAGTAATLSAVAAAAPAPEAPAGSPLPPFLRHLASASKEKSPRGRERAIPVARFAGGDSLGVFGAEVLEETTARIGAWWKETPGASPLYTPADFGFDPEAWVEGADEVVYRIAVAAALVFRLETDRDGVIRAYKALDQANVLGDLYHGTVPESLPGQVDARALMLASLAARRCAETPELAATLEQQKSAADAFATLDAALGRGLFRIELHWILGILGQLGVIRFDDLGELASLPHRLVRDTLFRLGFLPTPYAADGGALVAAARAARKAAGADPADEILSRFALAAGCAYDCPHRRACEYPCRERLE